MADSKNPSIFSKMLEAGSAMLDAQIAKARNVVAGDAQKEDEADVNWGKAITRDRNQYMGSQGFQEKAGALTFEYQKQMALKSSIIAAIVKTRQNRVASFAEYVPEGNKTGFKIVLKNEDEELEKIKSKLFPEDMEAGDEVEDGKTADVEGDLSDATKEIAKASRRLLKATIDPSELANFGADDGTEGDAEGQDPGATNGEQQAAGEPEEEQITEQDKVREAKKELEKKTKKKKQAIAQFMLHCGELENRPFESKKWTLDAYLRALIWDSLVYDQIATELIPKEAEKLNDKLNLHHFIPVDGSTIRYASQELAKYKNADVNLSQDILYPEEELKGLQERDTLTLDDQRLEDDEYKYVQFIRGRIQRAFTEDELKIGMRNPTTDIYSNGYSISELELLVSLVTSHLQTEFYNRSYFQQGFSAKGILHIKANLNRSKLEDIRRNWNHMVKGNRNSFQTPIMAGMDEVQWIPLTQSHSEMEFTMWLNYLIRMICAIYQIDPSEIGYGMKDEGGAGMSGDNTEQKLKNSKDKGFTPLMKFLQDYLNKNIVDNLDSDYMLEWVGLEEESEELRIARQEKEVKYKKSVNEIRAEDGLPPIEGADEWILDTVYAQYYMQFSAQGQKFAADQQKQQMDMMAAQPQPGGAEPAQDPQEEWKANEASAENEHMRGIESKLLDHDHAKEIEGMKAKNKPAVKKSLAKSLSIEYYQLGE